jgi:hypothetical protein
MAVAEATVQDALAVQEAAQVVALDAQELVLRLV